MSKTSVQDVSTNDVRMLICVKMAVKIKCCRAQLVVHKFIRLVNTTGLQQQYKRMDKNVR